MADLLIAVLVLLVCSGAESAVLMAVEAVLRKRAALEWQLQRSAKLRREDMLEPIANYDDWKLREPPESLADEISAEMEAVTWKTIFECAVRRPYNSSSK